MVFIIWSLSTSFQKFWNAFYYVLLLLPAQKILLPRKFCTQYAWFQSISAKPLQTISNGSPKIHQSCGSVPSDGWHRWISFSMWFFKTTAGELQQHNIFIRYLFNYAFSKNPVEEISLKLDSVACTKKLLGWMLW